MSTLISRRGFLGTLVAAAVGAAAQFDPLRGLWVPQTAEIQPVVIAGLADLNELALRFARTLSERLADHRVGALKQSVLQHVTYGEASVATTRPGLTHQELGPVLQKVIAEQSAAPPVLTVDGGRGWFQRSRRVAKTTPIAGAESRLVYLAGELLHELRRDQVDLFVPLTKDLRPGVPFSDDTLVTVVTDPESGLSVRAYRFTPNDGRELVSFEVGAGLWRSKRADRKRPTLYFSQRFDPTRCDA
jgi:hypothetical protein